MKRFEKVFKFFKKNKKSIDIYIVIMLISIIIALIFIVFPETTKNSIINTKIEFFNKKAKVDNYLTNKIIDSYEENNIKKEENNTLLGESEREEEIKTIPSEKIIPEEKFLLKRKDEKIYNIKESFILNYIYTNYEKNENNDIILDNNEIKNVAVSLNDFYFNEIEYKLDLNFNFKNLSDKDIKINKNNFYLKIKETDIIKNEGIDEFEIKANEEKDYQTISFQLDKNIKLEDLNLSFFTIMYQDELNIRKSSLLTTPID